jgi:hypothetical protein
MLIGYIIEAGLAAGYLIAFVLSKELRSLKENPEDFLQKPKNILMSRLVEAFAGTITNFIDSALLFSFAMLAATILIAAGNIRGIDHDFSKYSLALAQLTSLFSVAVVLSVWPLQWRTLRRKWLRNVNGTVLYIVALAAVWIRGKAMNENTWDIHCLHVAGKAYWEGVVALLIIPGAILLLFSGTMASLALLERLRIYKNCSFPNLPFDISLGWIIALYGFGSTWTLFAIFVDLRQRIQNAAGDSYQENQWGFGQVLAVGSWAPVIIEFLYILICEFAKFRVLP